MSQRKKPSGQSPPSPVITPPTPEVTAAPSIQSFPQKKMIVGVICVVAGLLVVFVSNRFFFSRSPSAKVEQARRMLQIERPRLAIELLAREDSAEGHYLKSIALQAIGQHDAARDQITEAISIAPHEIKYQGYNLLLQLNTGKPETADELIHLYELGTSSPGIAFFATTAFTKKKPPDVRSALKAFDLGITLIDDTPEFMSNAMHFAITTLPQVAESGDTQLHQSRTAAAERMLEKLEQVAPKDVALLKDLLTWSIKGKLAAPSQRLLQRITDLKAEGPDVSELRIKVAVMLGQTEAAIAAARQAILDNPGEVSFEIMLADTVWHASTTPEHEKLLSDLVVKHPENPEFVTKLALYLVRAKRLPDAVVAVNRALDTTKAAEPRAELLKLAVGIPMEANHPELSEQQVAKYKHEFRNANLVDYFEGRVLFMKKDLAGAKLKFQKILADPQIRNGSDQKLATECLIWQQKIQQLELKNAPETPKADPAATPKPTPKLPPVVPSVESPMAKPSETPNRDPSATSRSESKK